MKAKSLLQNWTVLIHFFLVLLFTITCQKGYSEIQIDAPEALMAEKLSAHYFTARWKTVPGATGYQLSVSDGNVWKNYEPGNVTRFLVSDLIAGRKYQYKVRAKSGTTFSAYSNVIDVVTVYPPVLLDPADIQSKSFVASWKPVEGNIIGYRLHVTSTAHPNYNPKGYPVDLVNTKHTVTGLYIGMEYEFYVETVTIYGTSDVDYKKKVETKTVNPTTNPPTNITATSFKANWSIVSEAKNYKLYVFLKDDTKYIEGYNGKTVSTNSETITGLQPGTDYKYFVSAVFELKESSGSMPVSVETDMPVPVAQTATNITATSFVAKWENTPFAKKYRLYVRIKSNSQTLPGYDGKETLWNSEDVTGLAPNTEYQYKVQAVFENNVSEFSNIIDVKTLAGATSFKVSLSSLPSDGGTTIGGGTFASGTRATVVANPKNGYEFEKWMDGATKLSIDANYTFTLVKDINLVAHFKEIPIYTLSSSVSPVAGGKVTGAGTYQRGTPVTVKASPNAGYMFENWTEGSTIVSTALSYTFTLNSNRTLTANFKQVSTGFTLSLNENPTDGGDATGGGIFASGTSVTIKATPNTGFEFVNWTEGSAVVSTLSTYSFNLTANRTLSANFKATATNYTISLSANPVIGGAVSGAGSFISGKTITVTATPNTGYMFVNWTENGLSVSTSAAYAFGNSKNRTLIANFTPKTTASTIENPEISAHPNPVTDVLIISGIQEKTSIRIYNITGTLVVTASINCNGTFDVSSLKSGIYMFVFENRSLKSTKKIIKN